jgi:prepilin-type processing-associated H-X9-DG protein
VRAGVWAPSVYPEYISDLNLWICPSAVNASELKEKFECPDGDWCGTCEAEPSFGRLDIAKVGNAEQHSYYYYGYAIDNDGAMVAALQTLRGYATAAAVNYGGAKTPSVPFDPLLAQDVALVDQALHRSYNPFAIVDKGTLQAQMDQALTEMGLPLGPVAQGTGGQDQLIKLREGIERFLITDINNPAGSATAQSELPVMWDRLVWSASTQRYRERFNHIPGGCNILFMDGHVEFKRYDAANEFPVSALQAYFGRL